MKKAKKDISNPLVNKGKAQLGIFFAPFSIINPEEEGNKFSRFLSIGHHFKSQSISIIDEEYLLSMTLIDAPLWKGTLISQFDTGTMQAASYVSKAGIKDVKFASNVTEESTSYHKSKQFLSSFKISFEKSEALVEGFSGGSLPYDFHFDLFGEKAFSAVSSKLDEKSLILCQSDLFRSRGFMNLLGHEYRVSDKSLAFLSRVDGSMPKEKKVITLTISLFDKDNNPLSLTLSSLPIDGFSFIKSPAKTFFISDPTSFSFVKGHSDKDGTIVPPKANINVGSSNLVFTEEGNSKLEAKILGVFNFAMLIRFGRVSGSLSLADGRIIAFDNASSIIEEIVDKN